MGADRPFTALIEPFKGCNLACRYCYSDVASGTAMSLETLAVVLGRIGQFLDEEGISRANITWHGGEPLLAGRDFYERAFDLCARLRLAGRVTHLMQTNGTLLDDDWCRLIARHDIGVSLSLDGPREVNDQTRQGTEAGLDVFSTVLEKSRLLERHHIQHAFLVVVTQANVGVPREIYAFFRGLRATFKVNPVMKSPHRVEADRDLGVTARQYGRFLCELFEAWMEDANSEIRVGTIDTYIKNVMAGRAFNCQHKKVCSDHIIGIRPDGSINPCTRFNQSSTETLHERSIRELRKRPPFPDIAGRAEQLVSCRKCEFVSICHGGCPQHAEAFYGDCTRKDYYCGAYKMIYTRIRSYLEAQSCRP